MASVQNLLLRMHIVSSKANKAQQRLVDVAQLTDTRPSARFHPMSPTAQRSTSDHTVLRSNNRANGRHNCERLLMGVERLDTPQPSADCLYCPGFKVCCQTKASLASSLNCHQETESVVSRYSKNAPWAVVTIVNTAEHRICNERKAH